MRTGKMLFVLAICVFSLYASIAYYKTNLKCSNCSAKNQSSIVVRHQKSTPWSWTSSSNVSSPLILDAGLDEFLTFFKPHMIKGDENSPSIHEYREFLSDFVSSYINYILTIRRTSWRQHDHDEAYAYNSAPSDLVILVLVPLMPPSFKAAETMHNMLSEIVSILRTVHGDKKTFLIDTSGWLDESDFVHSNPVPSDSSTETASSGLVRKQFPMPNAAGHKKLAYFLGLHVCNYIPTHDTRDCPFDGHETYTGKLYVPGDIVLSRVLEEKKIEKVQAMIAG